MLFQKKYVAVESELARLDPTDRRDPRAFRYLPLHSKTVPLIGLLATCNDEPLPNYMPNRESISDRDRTSDKGDLLIHGARSPSEAMYQRIKKQNILILKTQRALMESDMVREDRELERISRAVAERNRQEMVEFKRRQQVHETSVELRELEVQLHKARATLTLEEQKRQAHALIHIVRERGLQEAAEVQARVERETRKELEALRRKRHEFRTGLMAQIAEQNLQHSKDRHLAEADCKYTIQLQKDFELELAETNRLVAEAKVLLKKEMDKFSNLQKSIRNTQKPPPDVNDVGILDNCRDRTVNSQREVLEKRFRTLSQRTEISSVVGRQIYESDEKRRKREELITDLLIKERKASDDAHDKRQIENHFEHRRSVQNDLLLQRTENRTRHLAERHNERFSKTPSDQTSFNQRQYRYQDHYLEQLDVSRDDCCNTILQMISDNRLRKDASDTRDKIHMAAIQQALVDRDQDVAKERHLILSTEPVAVLASLKNGVLSKDELSRYGVPKRLPQKHTPIH